MNYYLNIVRVVLGVGAPGRPAQHAAGAISSPSPLPLLPTSLQKLSPTSPPTTQQASPRSPLSNAPVSVPSQWSSSSLRASTIRACLVLPVAPLPPSSLAQERRGSSFSSVADPSSTPCSCFSLSLDTSGRASSSVCGKSTRIRRRPMSLASTRSDGRSIPILASSARAFLPCSFSAQDTSLTRCLLTAESYRERVIGCKQTAPVSCPPRSGVGLKNAFLAFSPSKDSQLSDMRSSSTLSLSRNGPSKCVPSSCSSGCCCCSIVASLTSLRTLPPRLSLPLVNRCSEDQTTPTCAKCRSSTR